jgi:hypothetical protein
MTALCHSRVIPPSQGLGIGPQLQLVEVRRDERGESKVMCDSGFTGVLSAHRCLIVFLHKPDTTLKGYMSRDKYCLESTVLCVQSLMVFTIFGYLSVEKIKKNVSASFCEMTNSEKKTFQYPLRRLDSGFQVTTYNSCSESRL